MKLYKAYSPKLKSSLFCVLFFLHTFSSLIAENVEIIQNKALLPILTPAFSDRQTLKIKLENGLQAYIVSDPHVDSSSAVLTVKTGSWEDPEEYSGIAHFLEHMLFLGTKKYPNESHYCRFISENGGLYNAFTSNDATSYMFSIDNKAFSPALDCFSHFFIEPLFNRSGVDRELQAIDQEYAKNLENDDIREYYVFKELANPKHPNHAFGMGNKESLLKVSQEVLKKWYKEHYSANRMRLVVISDQPLDKLKELVVNDFSQIPNTNLPALHVPLPLIPDSLKGHMVYVKPLKNIRKVTLIWELPPQFADMKDTHPEQIVSFVLGHEGKKSLLALLKKEKLAESLAAGGNLIGDHNFEFYIEINLTDAGVKKVNDVILRCFEAIANFKKKGTPQYLFDEIHALETIDYQYQPREEAFNHIMKEARWIAQEDLSTYPEKTFIIQRFDPKAIEDFLSQLTPKNCVISLTAPASLTGITFDRTEQWLHVPYTVKDIPKETLQAWTNATPNPLIDLPQPNPFVPEKLTLANPPAPSTPAQIHAFPIPTTLLDNDMGKVYFAPDNIYHVPQIYWSFEFKTPAIDVTNPETIVLADLYIKNVLETLSDYTYPASLAGLGFNIHRTDNGLAITIEGYNDKAETLFQDLIKGLKDFHPNEHQFNLVKKMLRRQYQNAALEKPLSQASEILKNILYKHFVTDKQKAALINKINFEKFEEFAGSVFNRIYVEGTLYGNMLEEQAKYLITHLLNNLSSQPYPKNEHLAKEIITLPQDKGPFFLEAKTEAQGNALILTIETVPFSFRERAAQQILMQAMFEPFFTTLRTKQQTGYIVKSQAEEIELHLFNTFAVQSNTHDPRDLLARFEQFIEGFLQEISKSEVTLDRFENIKQALIMTLRPPPKSVSEMGMSLNRLAFNYDGDFKWIGKRIQALSDLTYVEFLEFATQTLGKHNKRRLAVLVTGTIPEENSLEYTKINSVTQIHKLSAYEPAMQMVPNKKE